MRIKHTFKAIALTVLVAFAPLTQAAGEGAAPPQANTARAATPSTTSATATTARLFPSPEAAVQALADALREESRTKILAIFGAGAKAWLSSGDPVADRDDWRHFLAEYDAEHTISRAADGRAFLIVGASGLVFPAPLMRRGKGWVFDEAAGREEVINRRVGRNELDTIQTLLAVVDAQREYAAEDADGNGYSDYARRFIASEGRRDGLYWPVAEGQPPSPLGPLVGAAAREGYGKTPNAGQASGQGAYHGYRYRILTAQGKSAPGGAYDYLVGDKLLGGFAVLAYPAKYGMSGVMSFMVNHEGVVFEKDLGPETASIAARLKRFEPGPGWKPSRP